MVLGLSSIAAAGGSSLAFYGENLGVQYLVWLAMGVGLLSFGVAGALSDRFHPDSLFLLGWLLGPLLFSVFLIPFQAVRHMIFVLPPLLLLIFRYIDKAPAWLHWPRVCSVLLVLQLAIGVLVQCADYSYAATYRDFSVQARERWVQPERTIWYVGHWGWKFYADRSGFRQLHRDGPYPAAGDIVLWPEKVHIGDVFRNKRGLPDRLLLMERVPYPTVLPLRTMSGEARAGFYAVVGGRLPYGLLRGVPLEVMRVFRVEPESKR